MVTQKAGTLVRVHADGATKTMAGTAMMTGLGSRSFDMLVAQARHLLQGRVPSNVGGNAM